MKVKQFRAVLRQAALIKKTDGQEEQADVLQQLQRALSPADKLEVSKMVANIKRGRSTG